MYCLSAVFSVKEENRRLAWCLGRVAVLAALAVFCPFGEGTWKSAADTLLPVKKRGSASER